MSYILFLFSIFEDALKGEATHLYIYHFKAHSKQITDVVMGYGGYNAIFVTSSMDQTCKVQVLSYQILLSLFY